MRPFPVREISPPCGEAPPDGHLNRRLADYDRALCLLRCDELDSVLAIQPREWQKLAQHHGAAVHQQFLKRVAGEIGRRCRTRAPKCPARDAGGVGPRAATSVARRVDSPTVAGGTVMTTRDHTIGIARRRRSMTTLRRSPYASAKMALSTPTTRPRERRGPPELPGFTPCWSEGSPRSGARSCCAARGRAHNASRHGQREPERLSTDLEERRIANVPESLA